MSQFFILIFLSLQISTFCDVLEHPNSQTKCDDCQSITSTSTFHNVGEDALPEESTLTEKFSEDATDSRSETIAVELMGATLKVPKLSHIVTKSIKTTSVTPILHSKAITSPVGQHTDHDFMLGNVTTEFTTTSSTDAPHLPKSSNDDDEIRKIIFILMIFIVIVLLAISVILLFYIRKYRAKNRRSIRV